MWNLQLDITIKMKNYIETGDNVDISNPQISLIKYTQNLYYKII